MGLGLSGLLKGYLGISGEKKKKKLENQKNIESSVSTIRGARSLGGVEKGSDLDKFLRQAEARLLNNEEVDLGKELSAFSTVRKLASQRTPLQEAVQSFKAKGGKIEDLDKSGDFSFEELGQSKLAFDDVQAGKKEASELGLFEKKEKKKREIEAEQKELGFLKDVRTLSGDINDLFDTYKEIPQEMRGPFAGRTTGEIDRIAQTEPAIADYIDTKQFFLSGIARSLGAERGVLTDKDIERVDGLFPKLHDNDAVALRKMGRVKRFIARRIKEKGTQAMLDQFNKEFQPDLDGGTGQTSGPVDDEASAAGDLSLEELRAIANQ